MHAYPKIMFYSYGKLPNSSDGNYYSIINTAFDVLFAVVSFPDTAAVQALVDL